MARLAILRLLDSYFRHRWLNTLPLVLMLCLGGVSFYLADPQYVSSGRIYVQKSSLLASLTDGRDTGFAWQSPTLGAVNEFNELVQTEAFVRSVFLKTDLEAKMSEGPDAIKEANDLFRKSLTVQMVGDNLIKISVKSKSPQLAQQLANATIDAYSMWKLNGDRQDSAVAQSFFAEVLPPYQKNLHDARDALKAYLVAHPVPLRGERPAQEQIEVDQLQGSVDVASKRVESALEKEESARLSQAQAESNVRQNYLVIDAPTLPLQPETSLKESLLSAAIFIVAGILLSIGGIVGGALLDRSFRFPLDVKSELELPVLAIVPDVSKVVQPPVLNEPTQKLSYQQDHNNQRPAPILRLSRKQRRARHPIPPIAQTSNSLTEMSDGAAS